MSMKDYSHPLNLCFVGVKTPPNNCFDLYIWQILKLRETCMTLAIYCVFFFCLLFISGCFFFVFTFFWQNNATFTDTFTS